MDYLLSTLESCSSKNFLNQHHQQGEILDVTIKLVRVVANMSVNNEVGYGLGVKKSLGNILLTLLLAVNNCKLKSVSSAMIKAIFHANVSRMISGSGTRRVITSHLGSLAQSFFLSGFSRR